MEAGSVKDHASLPDLAEQLPCIRMIGKSTMVKKDFAIEKYGRTEWIRTTDLHGPIVARYQTALRPDPLTNQHFQKPDASQEDSPVKRSGHLL